MPAGPAPAGPSTDRLVAQPPAPGSHRLAGRHLALTGFMGTGKTTVGAELGVRLGRPFVDLDQEFERREGISVADFFEVHGEAEFRRREAALVRELLELAPSVIALGGGTFVDPESRRLILERAVVVHLSIPWEQWRRLAPELVAGRPLLRDRDLDQVAELFAARARIYDLAHLKVRGGREGVERVAGEVLAALDAAG